MSLRKLIDIGANLTDAMYQGVYHGSKKHEGDLRDVLDRAWEGGLEKIVITGGSLSESKASLEVARSDPRLFTTVGCHPTRCGEFEEPPGPDSYLQGLADLVAEGGDKVVAIGECGLDYDRLEFCSKELQLKYLREQLPLSVKYGLPLFLHCRAAAGDLIQILQEHPDIPGGVVHSFDGTSDEARTFLDMGLYIGINGCSLKTKENLEVVKTIPDDRLLIETDCPWCEVRPTHAGSSFIKTKFQSVKKEKWQKGVLVKGRNEPVTIVQILEILASVRGQDVDVLCSQILSNTQKLFFPK